MSENDRKAKRPATTLSDRFKRGDVFSERCPSREVLRHVTSRWGMLVLVALSGGTHRFSDLRRKVGGVSERMLAQTLQWLVSDGFVQRKSYPVVPPHVEYSLTPLGVEVGQRVAALVDWIEESLTNILERCQEEEDKPGPTTGLV